MKLPSFRRIISTDYPKDFKQLVDLMAVSLNNGIEVLYQALNNQLTLRDNIKCTIKDVTLTVDSSGNPINTTTILLNANTKVEGSQVLLALNQVNSSVYVTSGPFITGSQNGTSFIINNITGLQANTEYLIRVLVYQA